MASTKIAIAGGSGGLGRALVEALKQHGGFEVFVLARKARTPYLLSSAVLSR
jgi:uncharacterized protein YbjT (DUF2867 family)